MFSSIAGVLYFCNHYTFIVLASEIGRYGHYQKDEFLAWKDIDARLGTGQEFGDVQLKVCLRREENP